MKSNEADLFIIFEDGDPFRAEVVRSALEAGEIDCFIHNAGVQNLFSMGSMGGINPLMGTVKVYIRTEDRAAAEALLADLQMPPEQEIVPETFGEDLSGTKTEKPVPSGGGFLSWLRRLLK